MYMDKKSAVLFQLSKDDHSIFFNVTCLDETSSAVQVEKPASGCDINTIPRDTILEFFLRPRAGSLTCTADGYSFILSMFAFEKCRAHSYLSPQFYFTISFCNNECFI